MAASYKYAVKLRGKAVAYTTTKREAEQEASVVGGTYVQIESVPAQYVEGFEGKALVRRIAEIQREREIGSYEPLKSDEGVATKRSKWSKKFEQAFGRKPHDVSDVSNLTGIPKQVLQRVYDRGLAAWSTGGHRPGASQHGWAMARVQSFVLGGPTSKGPDRDLAAKANPSGYGMLASRGGRAARFSPDDIDRLPNPGPRGAMTKVEAIRFENDLALKLEATGVMRTVHVGKVPSSDGSPVEITRLTKDQVPEVEAVAREMLAEREYGMRVDKRSDSKGTSLILWPTKSRMAGTTRFTAADVDRLPNPTRYTLHDESGTHVGHYYGEWEAREALRNLPGGQILELSTGYLFDDPDRYWNARNAAGRLYKGT